MLSTDQHCWKCDKPVKEEDLGRSWVYTTDTNEPHHLYKCLYPGEELPIV